MTKFIDTPDGEFFLDSANSRNTSLKIMAALAFFARLTNEAEKLWDGIFREFAR